SSTRAAHALRQWSNSKLPTVRSCSTSRRQHLEARARIEIVTQTDGQQVHRDDEQHRRNDRGDQPPESPRQQSLIVASPVNHRSDGWGAEVTQAKHGQRDFHADGKKKSAYGIREQERNQKRQMLAQDDFERAHSREGRGLGELLFAQRQYLGSVA